MKWSEDLLKDVRYGLRRLWKSPGFAAVAILTLALGIGANTAIFTLVHGVMLKSLPVSNPGELYNLGDGSYGGEITGFQGNYCVFSYPLYLQLRDNTPEFSQLAAFQDQLMNLSVRQSGVQSEAESYNGEFVSGNYFAVFGLGALVGRSLTPEDDQPNAQAVAVMSYRAWQQHYGLNPSVVGETFAINGHATTVIGVAPPGFFGDTLRSDPPDFWIPLAMEPVLRHDTSQLNHKEMYWLYAMGRLRPEAQPRQVEARMTAELRQWLSDQNGVLNDQTREQIAKARMLLTPGGGGDTGLQTRYKDGLRLLMMVSALVLLIACANVANLLLARAAANRPQTAVRVAIGATRARLVRQMLTEGVVLAVLGGTAGLLFAFGGTRLILLLAFRGANHVPISSTPSVPVLAFAFFLSLVTGVLFSAAPTWMASRIHPAEALRGAGRSTRDHSTLPQKSLVLLQAALSLALLVGAGLLTQSLRNLENQRFGFDTQRRVIVQVNPNLSGYSPEQLAGLYRQLQDRLSQFPGVLSASFSFFGPLDKTYWTDPIRIEGREQFANPVNGDVAGHDHVSAHYFETIGTRLLRGRVFNEHDTPTSLHVAVVNQAFLRKFFPHGDAIGKHISLGDRTYAGNYEIVGIVEDTKYVNPQAPAAAMLFLPLLQLAEYTNELDIKYQKEQNSIQSIQLHVAPGSVNLESVLRRTLADIDPNLAVLKVTGFDDQVSLSFNRQRLLARLSMLYGLLALILASVGLYGVAAYTVARRTSEIGIRMALGADRAQVVAMVMRSAMWPVALGLALGIPISLAAGRAIASQLYGVTSYDPRVVGNGSLSISIASWDCRPQCSWRSCRPSTSRWRLSWWRVD
jgi:predicted permease